MKKLTILSAALALAILCTACSGAAGTSNLNPLEFEEITEDEAVTYASGTESDSDCDIPAYTEGMTDYEKECVDALNTAKEDIAMGNYSAAYEICCSYEWSEIFWQQVDTLTEEAIAGYYGALAGRAQQFAANGDNLGAESFLRNAAEEFPVKAADLEELADSFYDAEVQTETAQAKVLYTAGDYSGLLDYLETAPIGPGKCCDELDLIYETAVLEYAEQLFGAEQNYISAVQAVNRGMVYLGETEALTEAADRYSSYSPTPLIQLDSTFDDGVSISDSEQSLLVDVNGGHYDYCYYSRFNVTSMFTGNEPQIEYYLGMEYRTLTGTIYRPMEAADSDLFVVDGYVRIYGDDILLYESPRFTADTWDSIDISVDVSHVRELRIVVSGVDDIGMKFEQLICLGNVIICK